MHVRSAVVLVRATVAEAFRDAKRGGGFKSAFADLPTEGLEGITFVLSPNARNVVVRALERNPSGTEKSVCISYILEGGKRARSGKDRVGGRRKVSGLNVCRDGKRGRRVGECGRGGGREEGLAGDDQPQTYIHGPNIYKHHVRIGATRNRPMSSVTEFASRPPLLRLVYHYVPACGLAL